MRRNVYAALMLAYIGFSILTINYASKWMQQVNFSTIASKARDIAILTTKNFTITNAEVDSLKKIEFKDLCRHPVNQRLEAMFANTSGYDDIRYVYLMVKLENYQVKYHVTEEYAQFYEAKPGTPLNLLWLVDVVIGKTVAEILEEDKTYYDDIKRYSYVRPSSEKAFLDRKPFYEMEEDEYGSVISGMAPVYSEEGDFVGVMGVDINIEEYDKNVSLIRWLLLLVFLLPSVILTAIYILLYIMNLKKVYDTAHTDPLTSVKNRRFMEKYLPQIVKEHHQKQQSLSVIMIDIDHFKAYNDNYGHPQGDKVLVDITHAISSILRDKTDSICRYGGEEFLVILTNTKTADAEKIAGRIKAVVNNLAITHEHSKVCDIVTISQGIYSAVPSNADSEKTFIEYADKALYKAKNSGRNQYIVWQL